MDRMPQNFYYYNGLRIFLGWVNIVRNVSLLYLCLADIGLAVLAYSFHIITILLRALSRRCVRRESSIDSSAEEAEAFCRAMFVVIGILMRGPPSAAFYTLNRIFVKLDRELERVGHLVAEPGVADRRGVYDEEWEPGSSVITLVRRDPPAEFLPLQGPPPFAFVDRPGGQTFHVSFDERLRFTRPTSLSLFARRARYRILNSFCPRWQDPPAPRAKVNLNRDYVDAALCWETTEDSGQKCSLCTDFFKKRERVLFMPCPLRHKFHRVCGIDYVVERGRCPLERAPIVDKRW